GHNVLYHNNGKGRFKNGTPLALYGEEQDQHGKAGWSNDFDYVKDPLGSRCPFHSHVRRVNPRNDKAKGRRIARRGIPYTEGTGKQGLLFLCFQSKIHDQFAYLHRNWANVDFPFAGTGIDPLIGTAGYQQDATQLWPREWGKDPSVWFDFSGVVTLKGGGFFFAPSIPFLRGLMTPAGT
ncbi:MAG TPA: hypothetical protein VLV54_21985, partial [Thermoanaerobaculia bacterium]|nr:hypothetical protein [Thermoanaerobaculia bacterium]